MLTYLMTPTYHTRVTDFANHMVPIYNRTAWPKRFISVSKQSHLSVYPIGGHRIDDSHLHLGYDRPCTGLLWPICGGPPAIHPPHTMRGVVSHNTMEYAMGA